jgi:uncharacterized protein with PIN domain
MIIDTSAIIAILRDESEAASRCRNRQFTQSTYGTKQIDFS